jgi:hypothetical protein
VDHLHAVVEKRKPLAHLGRSMFRVTWEYFCQIHLQCRHKIFAKKIILTPFIHSNLCRKNYHAHQEHFKKIFRNSDHNIDPWNFFVM